jgi:hypothetical protein
MKKTLVYGFYGHDNIGDELFKIAFEKLFPEYEFTFTDHLSLELLENKDALFFGGGSFLNQYIEGWDIWDINIPIFYIGIGLETEIHQHHRILMNRAELIASRSISPSSQLKYLPIPDLVYYQTEKEIRSLNVLKNTEMKIPY